MRITNTHSHIFTFEYVPERFLPLRLVRFLAKNNRLNKFARLLNWINPFSDNDTFQRYANFIRKGSNKSQYAIFTKMKLNYPALTRFVILSMDFEYMAAGKPEKDFIDQIRTLAKIKKRHSEPGSFIPFVMADPRRPNIIEIVKMAIEMYEFGGIKLYPPLGYYPFDKRLYPIYEYACKYEIPVVTHCSTGGIYYRGKINKQMLIHPKTKEKLEKKRNKDFCRNFTHPANFEYVLSDFPGLKLCFAHFGGNKEWDKYIFAGRVDLLYKSWLYLIKSLLMRFPNTYADISYTLADSAYLPTLIKLINNPKLNNKILFGSDFYMANIEQSEQYFAEGIKLAIGHEMFHRIATINPINYLKTKLC